MKLLALHAERLNNGIIKLSNWEIFDMAAQYNMICPQGATFSKRLTWAIDDIPVDLTGYTAAMQARDKYSSTTAVLDLTTENGGITLGGDEGTIDIYISDEDTAAVYAKEYVYDLELYSGGETTRLVQGKFIVTPEVTRV